MSKVTKTVTVSDVRLELQAIGDKAKDAYDHTGDVKVGMMSLKAYNAAVNAAKTQLIYKKLSGLPAKIDFLEK